MREQRLSHHQKLGRTVVCVGEQGTLIGLIALADKPRPSAAPAIAALKQVGIKRTIMLTGDHPEAARAIASEVGIDDVEAGLLPQQKVETVRRLDQQERGVVMIGDGVNDAPAMASATVSIAIGGATGVGSDVALETADIALLADDLRRLPEAVGLARYTHRIIRQNLVIALGVIAVLAPTAALGGAPISVAVMFHEGSTVLVVINALRILAWRSTTPTDTDTDAQPATQPMTAST